MEHESVPELHTFARIVHAEFGRHVGMHAECMQCFAQKPSKRANVANACIAHDASAHTCTVEHTACEAHVGMYGAATLNSIVENVAFVVVLVTAVVCVVCPICEEVQTIQTPLSPSIFYKKTHQPKW